LESECLAANKCLGSADFLAIANIPFAEFGFDLLFKGFEIYADLSVYNI
jgi:hypothetical protein